ncbi:MAG TPA: hypothetical protein VI818_00635, partial [Candidatus Thermoplasmatota archaeon]|nr:hypothetical protein [Candidatus Thermoplasmatota archaeon]
MWKDVPAPYPEFTHIGYGAVDNQSRDLAFGVLAGSKPLPNRERTDQYFMVDAPVRANLHTAYTSMP